METKKCFCCGRDLPLTEFYKHPSMADGRLNKCKECVKKAVHNNYIKNIESDEYVNKERARGRDKYRRLYAGKRNMSAHSENKNVRKNLKRKGINLDGLEIHHWNYNYPHNVFLLKPREHKRIHKFLTFDKNTNMFYYGEMLLDTKEKHLSVIKEILGKDSDIQSLNLESCR